MVPCLDAPTLPAHPYISSFQKTCLIHLRKWRAIFFSADLGQLYPGDDIIYLVNN